MGPRDGVQEFRKRQQAQSHGRRRGLVNREALIEPVVIAAEVQSIRYPKMKELVGYRRAQLSQRRNFRRQLSHQERYGRAPGFSAPLRGAYAERKGQQNESRRISRNRTESFAMRLEDFAAQINHVIVAEGPVARA